MALLANKSMNFTENQQGSAILEKLRCQREAGGRFCDVVLHVQNVQFYAHRNVLAACSPYFDSVFKMQKVAREQFVIGCPDSEVFHTMLNYIYTGSIIIDKQNISELLRLSNHFLLSKLKNYCAEYLERYLDVTNCLQVKDTAWKYNLQGLMKASVIFIQKHIDEVLEQEEILQYPLQKLEIILCDKNWTISQESLLRFLARWVKHNVADRQTDFRSLLTFIHWQKLDKRLVEDYLSSEDLYENVPQCLYFVLESIEQSGIQLENYHAMYLELKKAYESGINNIDSDKLIEIAVKSAIDDFADSPFPEDEEEMAAPVVVAPYEMEKEEFQVTKNQNEDAKKSNGIVLRQSIRQRGKNGIARSRFVSQIKGRARVHPLKLRLANLRQKAIATANRAGRKHKVVKPRRYMSEDENLKPRLTRRASGRPTSHYSRLEVTRNRHSKGDASEDDDDGVDENNGDLSNHYGDDSESDEDCSTFSEGGGGDRSVSLRWKEGVQCPHCSYVGHSSARLEQHVSRAHAQDVTYKCNLCGYTCKWNREYYRHMKHHFKGPPFRCDSCDYTCERIQFILSHRMRHTDEKPFKCDECDYRCRTKTNLMAHMRTHTGEKPYKCEHCGRCFAMKASLDQHLATHSDDRPFLCDTCGFTTKYQSHLLSHKRIHSGDVFPCQFPACNYSSPRRSQLAAHMRTHTAVRSHVCGICGRGFVEKSHLVRHERIHLNDKPFKCEQCEYSSSRRDKLKEHFQKHHSEFATAKVPYKPRRPRRQTFDPSCYPGLQVSEADTQVFHSQHSVQSTPGYTSFPDHQMPLHPEVILHESSHNPTSAYHHPSIPPPPLQLSHLPMVHPGQTNASHHHHHHQPPPHPHHPTHPHQQQQHHGSHIERLISATPPTAHAPPDHRALHHELDQRSMPSHPHPMHQQQDMDAGGGGGAGTGGAGGEDHAGITPTGHMNAGVPGDQRNMGIPHAGSANVPNASQVSDLNNLGMFISLF